MHTTRRSFLTNATLAGATALLAAPATARAGTGTAAPDFWEIVHARRAVRRYKPDPIPDEHLTRILDAARMAPTSGNQQPWRFLVIRDPAKIRELKAACIAAMLAYYDQHKDQFKAPREQVEATTRASYDGYLSAPVYVVVLTDNRSKYPDYNHYDGPLATATLMLAARALGYGTVFLTDSIPDAVTKQVFAIPDHYTRVCVTPIGVPAEWPAAPKKRPLAELVAYDTL